MLCPHIDESATRPFLEQRPGQNGIEMLRPIIPLRALGTPSIQFHEFYRLIFEVLALAGPNSILWVYAVEALPIIEAVRSQVKRIVYDCMDDYHCGINTPESIRWRTYEARLLQIADLIFTGGHSTYEARKTRHPRVYCFPSGVDVTHFHQTTEAATCTPAAVERIPHPRLGYFGGLDTRLDWALIDALAKRRPHWHWVFIGPLHESYQDKPVQASNLHYLGQQLYQDLPRYLKGFDVSTIPFVLTLETRFISPTKILEYLAGGKPVVSSSIPDVVTFYSRIVWIADGLGAWLNAIEEALAAPSEQHQQEQEQIRTILAQGSWDSITARMWSLIQEGL